MKAQCDAGCHKVFEVEEFQTDKIMDGIEKTYFACPNCESEYVCFYTDEEIRKLQVRIRRVQKRFADPNDNHDDAAKKETELLALIKEKMDALRQRMGSLT